MDFLQRLYNLAQQLVELMTALLQKMEHKGSQAQEVEYVDSAWVKETFGIASSTLSEYRRRGVIPYTYFEERGKIFYKKSEIMAILDDNHQDSLSH